MYLVGACLCPRLLQAPQQSDQLVETKKASFTKFFYCEEAVLGTKYVVLATKRKTMPENLAILL